MFKKKKLGDMLLEAGVITEVQLEEALEYQHTQGIKIGEALVELGYLTEDAKTKFLSQQLGLEIVDLSNFVITPELSEIFSKEDMLRLNFIPYSKSDTDIKVVVVDPFNVIVEDYVRAKTGLNVHYVLANDSAVKQWLDRFTGEYMFEKALNELEVVDFNEDENIELDLGDDSPTINLVNKILSDAIRMRASDIHIMPTEDNVNVRYRIDGVLQQIMDLPKSFHPRLTARIKIMADMDIAVKRLPQDGKIAASLSDNYVDMRVSTLPSVWGEKITIRVLDTQNLILDINHLGFSKENLEKFKYILNQPYGIFLITGPTGCGKSTTLRAAISELNDVTRNIVTLEDPVEYRIPGVTQVQVNEKAGLTFVSGFREILRQDPDIILVGEIRDVETASIAVQASNTGHLVFSTLHTNDSCSAVTRLLDFGIEPFNISGALLAVMSQRLVRKICPYCKEEYYLPKDHIARLSYGLGDGEIKLYRGTGCKNCNNTGYSGLIAIHELLLIDDDIQRVLKKDCTPLDIKQVALKKGFKTLKDDAIDKVLNGITSLDEIKRVIGGISIGFSKE